MKCCKTIHLKVYQTYNRSKLKVQLLLRKFRLFNLHMSYFRYYLKYRAIQYLIKKAFRYGKDGSKRLSCGSTSSICQDILKSDNLLHKQVFVKTQSLRTVIYFTIQGHFDPDMFFSLVYYRVMMHTYYVGS